MEIKPHLYAAPGVLVISPQSWFALWTHFTAAAAAALKDVFELIWNPMIAHFSITAWAEWSTTWLFFLWHFLPFDRDDWTRWRWGQDIIQGSLRRERHCAGEFSSRESHVSLDQNSKAAFKVISRWF